MKTITHKMLIDAKACHYQMTLFKRAFPDDVTAESEHDAIEQYVAVSGDFDFYWMARNLLSQSSWKTYEDDLVAMRKTYEDDCAAMRKTYEDGLTTEFAKAFWAIE